MKDSFHTNIKIIKGSVLTRLLLLISLFFLLSVNGLAQLTVTPTAIPNPLCAGAIVQLNAGASGGSGSYTYTWTSIPPGFTSTIINPTDNPAVTTTYNVAVFDGTNTVNGQVTVTVTDPAAPTGSSPQSFCSITSPTLANIEVIGTSIKWYAASSGGSALLNTTPLVTGTTYYASQTIGGCESETRLAVAVTVADPAAPIGSSSQSFCSINNPKVSNLGATGTSIQWYLTSSGGVALSGTTSLINGTTYYASQTISGCESDTRLAVAVTVADPAAPIGSSSQSFCSINSPKVSNLVATGTSIQWYLTSSGGVALSGTTSLINGTTYYASQTISGCESDTRLAVAVTVADPAAPTGSSSQSFCSVISPTLANIIVTGTLIKWYAASSGGIALLNTTPLVNGTTYYASQTISGCESDTRLAVTVTLTPNNTITRTSALGTDAQTACINTSITNITYSTTGATGANVTGLPSGVTGNWSANIVTISGTPSVAGSFPYTVTSTGGCGTITASGSITVIANNTISLSSAAGTNAQTVCINTPITNITYTTTGATGASVTGLPSGVTGNWAANVVTISGTPTVIGTFPYTVTLTGGCGTVTATGSIVVSATNTITLISGVGTNNQTVCLGTPITNIIYTTTGATGASFSGFPAGVTESWAGNIVTISGSPTTSVGSPYNYTVTLTGGCGTVTASGSITVTSGNTVNLSSGAGTNNQTVCSSTAITDITFATTGATGATVTGLPAGVTGTWLANTVTIQGIPTVSGVFPYTVTLTGGCGLITATGTITVNPIPIPTLTSSAPGNVSCAGTNVTFTAGGGTSYSFRINSVIKQTGPSNIYTTNLLTNGSTVDVVVTNATGCSSTSASILNFVNQPPFIFISTPATCSIDLATYSLAVTVSSGSVTSTSGIVTSTGSNVWTITGVLAGINVTLTVTDSGGCQNTLSVTAPNCSCPVVLPPVSGGDKSYCSAGIIPSINATVITGETVDWYNAASGGTILLTGSLSYTPTAAGTFYALARNTTTNCVSTTRTPITVTMNPLPIPTLTSSDANNIFCAGTSVTFTAGGGTSYNFRVGGVSVQSGVSTTYTTTTLTNGQIVDVIVTGANGCAATSAGITNTVNAIPVPTLTSSATNNTFCLGTSVTFTAGGGTNYNFRVGGISVQNSASATYITTSLTNGQIVDVVVTNANGCIATSAGITNTVYVIPTANAGTGGNNCGLGFHLNATLNVGIGTWSKVSGPGNASFSPDVNTANATVTVTAYGTYTFAWTVVNGTCSTSANVTVIFIQQPPANAGLGGNSCNKNFILSAPIPTGTGTWTKVTGPGNAIFTPDNHHPDAEVTVDQFGSYSFAWTVVNSTCTSSDIITVGFHDLPAINAGRDTTICKGSSIQLQAQGTGSVSWIPVALVSNPNIINPVATPDTTTTFTVNLTDQFGCKNSDSIVIEVREKVVANAGPDQLLGYLFSTTMDAILAYSYEKGVWSIISGTGEFIDSTYAKTTVNRLSVGENKFLWTVTNGFCPISHDTVMITVNDFVIPTLITPNMDGKNDYFVLRGLATTLGKTELIIFDRRGVQVYKNMNYDNLWNGVDYNNKPLPDDTYFYVIKTANGKSISGYVVIRR